MKVKIKKIKAHIAKKNELFIGQPVFIVDDLGEKVIVENDIITEFRLNKSGTYIATKNNSLFTLAAYNKVFFTNPQKLAEKYPVVSV